jgi:hypothetical protein
VIGQNEIERYLDDWLGNAPMAPADRVVVAVAVRIGREKQRSAPRLAWALADLFTSTRLLAGVTAVVLVALVGYAALRNPGPNGSLPTPFPTSTPTFAPTAVPSPTPRLLGIEASLAGGLPTGWIVSASGLLSFHTEAEHGMIVDLDANQLVMAETCEMGPEPGVGRSAVAFVNAIAERPGLTVSAVSSVEISGLTGRQIDVTLDASVGPTCSNPEASFVPLLGYALGAEWHFVGVFPDEHMRIIVLDVPDGQNILINITAPDGPTFERHIADAMTIVGKLSFDIS